MPSRKYVWIDGEEVEITAGVKLTPKQKAWCKVRQIKLPGVQGIRLRSTWPMTCDSSGCNPIQRQQFMEHSEKIGVPPEFNEIGPAVYTDDALRRRYCEETKFYDRNAGYSDPQKHNRDIHPDA